MTSMVASRSAGGESYTRDSPHFTLCVLARAPVTSGAAAASASAAAQKSSIKKGNSNNNNNNLLFEDTRIDVPVTNNTRVISIIREVAEVVLPSVLKTKGAAAEGRDGSIYGAMYHKDEELPPDTAVATIPRDAILRFVYGAELRRRGGNGCELMEWNPSPSHGNGDPKHHRVGARGQKPAPLQQRSTNVQPQGYGYKQQQQQQPYNHSIPLPPPRRDSPDGSEGRHSSYGHYHAGRQTPPGYPGHPPNPNYAESVASTSAADRKLPSTAPVGNPWGMEERGSTYRIPIRSTSDAPYDPYSPPPTPAAQGQATPTSPASQASGAMTPTFQQPPPQAPPMMMMGTNGYPMMMVMPMPMYPPPLPMSGSASSYSHPGDPMSYYNPYYPQMMPAQQQQQQQQPYRTNSPRGGPRGPTQTPQHDPYTTHAAQPPSVSASESKISRSQRFFGGSEPNSEDVLTFVSEPRECHGGHSPVEVENTARKPTYNNDEERHLERYSPPPSRPPPRRLDFDHMDDSGTEVRVEERENRLQVRDVPQTNKPSNNSSNHISGREAPQQRSGSSAPRSDPVTPASQILHVEDDEEEDIQKKRKNLPKKKPSRKGDDRDDSQLHSARSVAAVPSVSKSKPVALGAAPIPDQTVFSVVSNIEPSDEYVFLILELPEGVDPQLVCGLGDNSANTVTVGTGTPVPEDVLAAAAAAAGGRRASQLHHSAAEVEATRRLRVHRDTPVGTLRELLDVKPTYGILVDGVYVHDDMETLQKLGAKNESVISFAEVKKKPKRQRSTALPAAFLSAMAAKSDEPFEGERTTSIQTPLARPSPISKKSVRERRAEEEEKRKLLANRTTTRQMITPKKAPQQQQSKEVLPRLSKPNSEASYHSLHEVPRSTGSSVQVVSPGHLTLQSGLDSNQVTPRTDFTEGTSLRQPSLLHGDEPSFNSGIHRAADTSSLRHSAAEKRSSTKPPGDERSVSHMSPNPAHTSTISTGQVVRPGVLNPAKTLQEERDLEQSLRRGSASRLEPLQHDDRRAPEPTIDVDDYSSAEEEEEEEALRRMLEAARSPPGGASGARCPVHRRSSVTVSHEVTTRRQRVKRSTRQALTVGVADDSLQHSEMDDTIMEHHNSKQRKRREQEAVPNAPTLDAPPSVPRKPVPPPGLTCYTFKRRDSENTRQANSPDKMFITIQDPHDPEKFHRDVPVDQNCPVSILKAWLLRDGDSQNNSTGAAAEQQEAAAGNSGAAAETRMAEAVARAKIYYRGERVPEENERMTFKAVTEFFPNGIFSFQPPTPHGQPSA